MNKNRLWILWAVIFLAGCSSPIAPTSMPASQTPALTAANLPTITPSPTPITTAIPESRFTRQCLPTDDIRQIEWYDVDTGTILFSMGVNDDFILRDVHTKKEYQIPTETKNSWYPFLVQISPDQEKIALMEWVYNDQGGRISNILWIFDARANILSEIIFDRTDLGRPHWLDNERLIIDTEEYGVLLLINPFTGKQEPIVNDLPNLYPYDKPHLWWPVVYSPDLEWVTYMTSRTEQGITYIEGPVVYGLVAKQIIWDKANGVGSRPVWSPDGQVLAFTGGMDEYQLFLFNRSGSIKTVLDASLPHRAFEFSWSPDGSYIAFWTEDSLMIYDREQDRLFDTCIQGNFQSGPDWSPDSNQFIINQSSAEPLLVDWEEQMVYKINYIENSLIYGWMNSIP